jgi:hypothetical protein
LFHFFSDNLYTLAVARLKERQRKTSAKTLVGRAS